VTKEKKDEVKVPLPAIQDVKITRGVAPYAPEEQLGLYTVKRWNWTEKSMATQHATVEVDRQRGIIKWDVTIYYQYMLLYSVRKYPEKVNWSLDFIKNELDPDVGDILQVVCVNLNTISAEEKKAFLGQLSSGTLIHGLTSIGPVPPSESSQKEEV